MQGSQKELDPEIPVGLCAANRPLETLQLRRGTCRDFAATYDGGGLIARTRRAFRHRLYLHYRSRLRCSWLVKVYEYRTDSSRVPMICS